MLKRLFDIVFATVGLLLLLPLLIVIAIWIKLDSPGPVFFRQQRVGRFGKEFRIHKFRTMRVNAETSGRLTVGKDSRITRSGHFLRKSKIDELPQLIDVVTGKMSLVGPRPEVQEFIDCYPDSVRKEVLSVRPGITDRASIEMVDENEILANYPDPRQAYIDHILPVKQRYYVEYVRKHGVVTDIKIILDTLLKIIKRN
ncbi:MULTISPECIES: sugar transferase [unclassified Arsukibacterium]|uniref:sugar transferase n=1 Tax=unclassified Arsukibacterium TaxID=2635278 RepID=UPI000C8E8FD0|nr:MULTISPECIES: sugar transferase [unclassified Arsukibacterium]MAA96128.1 glycosyl transferase [Rheinheimera sp.]HAW94449.1 glycosyl transferase [Candidatus Azambacteria bacterium]|tara:strand:+ start:1648 stop:2244 length:597 start_codon:yes stop_codon:yes gene_type:complete